MVRDSTDRRTFLTSAGTAVALGLAGCTGDGGDTPTETHGAHTHTTTSMPSGEPLVIGNAAPLSGPIAPWGQLHQQGLQYAADQLNQNGGIGGREVSVVTQDTQADPATAATAVRRLANEEGAAALTGPVLSSTGIRIRQVAEELEVPHIPNLAASANLLTKDTQYTFRLAGAATPYIARGIGGWIEEQGWTQYGAMIADYAYGHSYQEAMEEYITSMEGLSSTVRVVPQAPGPYTSQLRQMPDDLEFLDVAGHPIAVYDIVEEALNIGLDPAAMTGATQPSGQFYGSLGEIVAEGLTTFPPVDVTASDYLEVANAFHEATGNFFDPFVSFGVETVNLVDAAVEESGDASAQGIRDGLLDVEYDTILAYPSVAYNEWGELMETKLFGQQFVLEAPDYYPDGDYSFTNVYETEVFGPVDPTNWGQ